MYLQNGRVSPCAESCIETAGNLVQVKLIENNWAYDLWDPLIEMDISFYGGIDSASFLKVQE